MKSITLVFLAIFFLLTSACQIAESNGTGGAQELTKADFRWTTLTIASDSYSTRGLENDLPPWSEPDEAFAEAAKFMVLNICRSVQTDLTEDSTSPALTLDENGGITEMGILIRAIKVTKKLGSNSEPYYLIKLIDPDIPLAVEDGANFEISEAIITNREGITIARAVRTDDAELPDWSIPFAIPQSFITDHDQDAINLPPPLFELLQSPEIDPVIMAKVGGYNGVAVHRLPSFSLDLRSGQIASSKFPDSILIDSDDSESLEFFVKLSFNGGFRDMQEFVLKDIIFNANNRISSLSIDTSSVSSKKVDICIGAYHRHFNVYLPTKVYSYDLIDAPDFYVMIEGTGVNYRSAGRTALCLPETNNVLFCVDIGGHITKAKVFKEVTIAGEINYKEVFTTGSSRFETEVAITEPITNLYFGFEDIAGNRIVDGPYYIKKLINWSGSRLDYELRYGRTVTKKLYVPSNIGPVNYIPAN